MIRLSICLLGACFVTLGASVASHAQTPPPAAGAGQAVTAPRPEEDDAVLKPAEPDFTLISLPTSLRVPKYKSAFRVTHRFTRPLSCDFCANSFAGDAFGIDNGADIGLEYRVGIVPNGEIGIHRTNQDKTIELFGQYGLTRQSASLPVETSVLAAVDAAYVGAHGIASRYSPALGLIVTRLIGDQAAVYVEPIWVHHTNLTQPTISDNDTFLVGLGARVRIRPTVYIVGEFAPRVSGYKPGVNHGSFAIEKRAGGHLFQMNFSDSFGTALSQIARGGPQEVKADGSKKTNWYMGFNISRKFY